MLVRIRSTGATELDDGIAREAMILRTELRVLAGEHDAKPHAASGESFGQW